MSVFLAVGLAIVLAGPAAHAQKQSVFQLKVSPALPQYSLACGGRQRQCRQPG